jgi:23S rRNA (guanosine2251-2'-O)-methyltransferase
MKNKFDAKRNNRKPSENRQNKTKVYSDLPLENEENGITFGRNAVRELLVSGRDVDKIFVFSGEREGSIKLIVAMAIERKIPVIEVDKSKLDALTQGAAHQGIVAFAPVREYSSLEDILEYAEKKGEAPFVVILDELEDPHNLGAILRSVDCLGAHGVIIPKRRAVGLTATVGKSSAGAVEHVKVARVTNIAQAIDTLKQKGLWVYGADMDGSVYYSTDFSGSCALVLGSEGFGISRLVREKCDFLVSIPMYGKVNSMNVSCAAAVLLSEISKQRNTKKGV